MPDEIITMTSTNTAIAFEKAELRLLHAYLCIRFGVELYQDLPQQSRRARMTMSTHRCPNFNERDEVPNSSKIQAQQEELHPRVADESNLTVDA
jgi:hypothetical protein